jgi:CRISPR-associated endonuclease/helicase Cas3
MTAETLATMWGKANAEVSAEPHPVLLHMLDVAAVGLELMDGRLPPALSADLLRLTQDCQIEPADVAFILSCHDLGKITPGFQAKVAHLADRLAALGADFPPTATTDHANATAALGPALLKERGVHADAATLAIAAVSAHHGAFHPLRAAVSEARFGGPFWRSARALAIDSLIDVLGASLSRLSAMPSDAWLMAMAGLTVLADWVGSDTRFFPYHPARQATVDYLAEARARARVALDTLGFRRLEPDTAAHAGRGAPPTFESLFGFPPRPMQSTVATAVDGLEEPGLLIVEAPTGGGKTEAALYAAESMMTRFGLGGIYFALPTQATSNQMFGRVRRYLETSAERRASGPVGRINLQLLHGSRGLSEAYAELTERAFRPSSIDGHTRTDNAVVAETWFSGKKRGLLSPFAVGTVDQSMMAALKGRHFFLRMFGLTRKVLIIDEVHAYDAFMSRILDRLLAWLRVLGSGVVLLSATLPAQRKSELVRAWCGRGALAAPPTWPEYPRVVGCAGSVVAHRIPRDAASAREVALRLLRPGGEPAARIRELAESLVEATANGGCIAWIHNTVGEAQTAYRALVELGISAGERILFHARFPLEDRLTRERRVLSTLEPTAVRPHRLIVVATQVIEQSLDIDFDLMVTALAPIDLLIQRAGRLHRHAERAAERPATLATPTLWIVAPSPDEPAGAYGPSGYVYDPHILLRTEWALSTRTTLRTPEDADALMAEVYPGTDTLDVAPESLPPHHRAFWAESARGLANALELARSRGAQHLVPMPVDPDDEESFLDTMGTQALDDPEDAPHKHEDVLARTRDMEPTVTLICLSRDAAGRIVLSDRDNTTVELDHEVPAEQVRRLLERAITVQHRGVVRQAMRLEVPAGWRRTAALRFVRPLVFDARHRSVLGTTTLSLDPELGLIVETTTTPEENG